MPSRMRWTPGSTSTHERIRRENLRNQNLRREAQAAALAGQSFAAFRITVPRGVAEAILWLDEDVASIATPMRAAHVGAMMDIWKIDEFVIRNQDFLFG